MPLGWLAAFNRQEKTNKQAKNKTTEHFTQWQALTASPSPQPPHFLNLVTTSVCLSVYLLYHLILFLGSIAPFCSFLLPRSHPILGPGPLPTSSFLTHLHPYLFTCLPASAGSVGGVSYCTFTKKLSARWSVAIPKGES